MAHAAVISRSMARASRMSVKSKNPSNKPASNSKSPGSSRRHGRLSRKSNTPSKRSFRPSQQNVIIPPNCPPGMEPLVDTAAIIVRQMMEMTEVVLGFNGNNCYDVLDMRGQRMFIAATEETSGLLRTFCKFNRPYTILIMDNYGNTCMKIERDFFWNTVKITTDGYFGKIDHNLGPNFTIYDDQNKAVLTMHGSCCCHSCEAQFRVDDVNGREIGTIHKNWGGYLKEVETYTNSATFGVNFSRELDIRLKTLLIGAIFLIDSMYFEGCCRL